jgi:hypothetical protein
MNYAELKAASIAYADRYDVEVDDNIDLFIIMVEARINRVLKTREQSTILNIDTVTDQEYYDLPADYAGMRDIQIDTAPPPAEHSVIPMHYLTPEQMNRKQGDEFNQKFYYSIIGSRLQFHPTIDDGASIEILYYQKVPRLTSIADENWLSISHPDIYVAGMVAEIELFAKNYEAGELWYSRMTSMIEQLDSSDVQERWSGTSLQVRIG